MLTGPSGLTVELCYQRYGTGKNGWSVRWCQSEFCGRAVFLPIGRRQLFRPLLYTVKNILTWVMFAWYLSCSIDPSRGRRHDHLDGRTPTRQTWLHRRAWLPTAILYCLTEVHTKAKRSMGATDKGSEGMRKFFVSHVCGPLCRRLGLNPVSASSFGNMTV